MTETSARERWVQRERQIEIYARYMLNNPGFSWRECILRAERFVDEMGRRMECAEAGEQPYTDFHDYTEEEKELGLDKDDERKKDGPDDEDD